jgi:hypothetical protein
MRFGHISLLVVALVPIVSCTGAPNTPPRELVGSSSQAICSSAGLSSDQANNFAMPGTLVTWTATAGCDTGDTPTYEFWIEPPGGSWGIICPYSTTNTCQWDTTGDAIGMYNAMVWVENQGSSAAYESNYGETFTLGSVTECASASATTSPSGQTSIGDAVTITSSASCGSSTPEFQIWMEPPGGSSFSMLQDYSESATYTWDTSSASAGTYNFSVWARAEGSTNAYDSYVGFYYTLSAPCSSATVSFDPSGSSLVGNLVTVTAVGTCGGTPTYEFWSQPNDGVTPFSIVQSWSTNATYNWDTTGASPGGYNFMVWVENEGSAASYETYVGGSYSLTGGAACTDGALSASPASPMSSPYSQITFTGSASTCTSAQYQFWEQDPGESFTMVQDWSTTATFDWTGTTAGSYNFIVWIRQDGSTGSYDTYGGTTYELE